jgi:hypothetical protein
MPPEEPDDRRSGMRLDITFSVGYERRRAGGVDRWEARGVTAGLLVAGVAVTVLVLFLISRLLSGL